MSISRTDPDYLALKAKGGRRINCTASQIVLLMDHIMCRDEDIADLMDALVQADLTIRSRPGADQSDVEFIRAAIAKATGQ